MPKPPSLNEIRERAARFALDWKDIEARRVVRP
jgi:hypothetical protein